MQWIFDHFQIVALVALAVGSMIKQILERRAEAKQAGPDPRDDESPFGDEEPSWRPEPPPLPRRVEPPPIPRQIGPAPAARPAAAMQEETGELLRRQLEMQERFNQLRKERTTAEPARATPAAKSQLSRDKPRSRHTIRPMLSSRASLRQAVILREILGPPAGLR